MKLAFGHKVNAYQQLFATLHLLLDKIRRKGLIATENDIENPKESAVFNAIASYDIANEVVYTFVCDALRLMVSGNLNLDDMLRYMDAYRKTSTLSDEQSALFDCVRLTIIATLNGNAPSMAIEHGRQGVPAKEKPTFQELEDFIRSVKRGPEPTAENIESRLKDFYASLDAK